MKINSKRAYILGLICIALFCVFGLYESITPKTASASVSATNLSMYQGMAIDPIECRGKVSVSVTAEQNGKLNEPPTKHTFLWKTWYSNNPYYIALLRLKTLDKYYQIQNGGVLRGSYNGVNGITLGDGEFMELYHTSETDKISLETINGESYYALVFNLPIDYMTEYYYFAVFVEEVDYIVDDTLHGEGISYHYSYYKAVEKSSNYIKRSVKYVAENALANDVSNFDSEQIAVLQRMAGLTVPDKYFTVNLKYKRLRDYGDVQTVTEQYRVDSLYVLNKGMVTSSVFNLAGITNLYDFNCIYTDIYSYRGVDYPCDSFVYLIASDYTYSYDSTLEAGLLEIVYEPFLIKDFAIRVKDNDTSDNFNCFCYVFFTNITWNESTDMVTMSIPYEGANADNTIVGIKTQLFNRYEWYIDTPKESDFSVGTIPTGINVIYDKYFLTIKFDKDDAYKLEDLSITLNANIIPDYECSVNVNYKALDYVDGNITVTNEMIDVDIMYSDYLKNYTNSSAFYYEYGEIIENAIFLEMLEGKDFYVYDGIDCEQTDDTAFSVTVKYTYNTLLKVQTNTTHYTKLYVLDKNSLTYKASDFEYGIPEGYILSGFSTSSPNDVDIEFDKINPMDSTVTVTTNVHQNKVITLIASFTKDTTGMTPPDISDETDNPTEQPPNESDEIIEIKPDEATDDNQSSLGKVILAVVLVVLLVVVVFSVIASVSNEINKG